MCDFDTYYSVGLLYFSHCCCDCFVSVKRLISTVTNEEFITSCPEQVEIRFLPVVSFWRLTSLTQLHYVVTAVTDISTDRKSTGMTLRGPRAFDVTSLHRSTSGFGSDTRVGSCRSGNKCLSTTPVSCRCRRCSVLFHSQTTTSKFNINNADDTHEQHSNMSTSHT